ASFSSDMHSAGSISCNSASNVIKGVGTSFSKIFQPDDIIYDKGGWACGVAIGQIATVNNNTTITLYENAKITLPAGSKFCGSDAPSAFAAINHCGLSGNLTLTLNEAPNESGNTSLKKWNEFGAGNYKILINCFWANTIAGNNASGIIKLDGCSNVTFSGGDPWGNMMTFRNNNTVGPTLVFLNGANHNIIEYCCFENRNTINSPAANLGAILFSTSNGPNGNNYNVINNCLIRNRSDISAIAHNGICSFGSPSFPNSFNTISNCSFDIIDNYNIWITETGNGDGWSIKNNIFYWDKATPATTAQAGIYFNSPTSNANNIINNYIGRDGPPYFYGEWLNNAAVSFTGIYLNVGSKSLTRCDSNNVAHIKLSSTSSTNLYGIYVAGGKIDIKNNGIGDGFWLYTGPQNTLTLSGTGTLGGIYIANASEINIDNNAIYALTRTNTAAGANSQLFGIGVAQSSGPVIISNNIINSITGSSSYNGIGNLSSVCGIFNYSSAPGQLIYSNNISTLENIYAGSNVIAITGIALKGPSANNSAPFNICSNNSIYIDGNNRNGATTKFANITGIDIQDAAYDIVNNMIMLGYDNFWFENSNPYIISCIRKNSLLYAVNIYFNSVFIVGTSNSATERNSYCYYSNNSGVGAAANIINNIFYNARTNIGAKGFHYAIQFNQADILDYNDYFVSGTGALLSPLANSLPLKANQDINSLNIDPDFVEQHCQPCPWNNLHILNGCALNAKAKDLSLNNPPYIIDFDKETRSSGFNNPDIGADEFVFKAPLITDNPDDVILLPPPADSAVFTVTASADNSLSYQWQLSSDNGKTWSDIYDGGSNPAFSGALTSRLLVKAPSNPLLFRCIVISCGEKITSTPAALLIDGLPVFTAFANGYPGSYNLCPRSLPLFIKLYVQYSDTAACSAWKVAWAKDNSKFWDGKAFNSDIPLWNFKLSDTLIISSSGPATYTFFTICEDEQIPQYSSSVITNAFYLPDIISAVPGSPVNGSEHFMNISWSKVSGASYMLQYSLDNQNWFDIYKGNDTAFAFNAGDAPDTGFLFRVKSFLDNTFCEDWEIIHNLSFTAPDFPALFVFKPTGSSIKLILQDEKPIPNPPHTTYALFCSSVNMYIDSNGAFTNDSTIFQTKAQWDTLTLKGLLPDKEYCFYAIARNQNAFTVSQKDLSLQCIKTLNCKSPITSVSPSVEKCEADSVTLKVFTKPGNYTFQWKKGDNIISSETNSQLFFSHLLKSNSDIYSCEVTDSCSTAISPPIALKVATPPVLNVSSLIMNRTIGSDISFSLSPTGEEPFLFQWFKDDISIDGATDDKFSIINCQLVDAGVYSCSVSNKCGAINEKIATLFVSDTARFILYGVVFYDNAMQSPLQAVKVFIENSENSFKDSVLTDISGKYVFINLIPGKYNIFAKSDSKWSGVNPIDALIINKAYLSLFKIKGKLKLIAANVNKDDKINPLDALYINRRYIGSINKFHSGNWYFESALLDITKDIEFNLSGICFGDVDGSYKP
ncbi:MAG: hypothetical protein KA792_07010, partial [Bacteroidales bacterium]|nr:hypothetical protein [Bacteroidales bacterium]